MNKLSSFQKLAILIILLLIVIFGCVFLVLKINKKSAASVIAPVQNATQNTIPNQIQVPVPAVSKNYNQIVSDITAKQKDGTATAADLIDLGVAYVNLGKLDEAETAYLQAIAKDPSSSQAYNNLANIYRDKSDFIKAEQNYKTAIKLDPQNSKTYINLAFMYNNLMNNKQSAIDILNQGLVAIPDNSEMKNLLAEYSK